MDTLTSALSKGIPNSLDIPISFSDITELSSNKEKSRHIIESALIAFMNKISSITNYSFKLLFSNNQAQVNTDVDTFTKYISISSSYFKDLVIIALNIDGIATKMKQNQVPERKAYSKEKALERLEQLKGVKNESTLCKLFPSLYMSYEDFAALKSRLEVAKRQSSLEYLKQVRALKFNQRDLEMFEKITTFNDFINYTVESLQVGIEKIDEISKAAIETRVDSGVFDKHSSEKLELYLADTFSKIAAHPTTKLSIKQKCAYYLSAYMFENMDLLDDGLVVERLISNINDTRKEKVTKRSVYRKFRQLLIDHPELFNVNFDYHIFNGMQQSEIDALMASYLETLKLQWEIIPEGTEIIPPKEEQTSNDTAKPKNNTQRQPRTQKDELELFYEKKTFFDSTEPLLRVMGKGTFDGYVGYIYPNGQVVLDQYYENYEKKRLAKDVAIYSMGIDDFYRLSQLSKTEIIRDRLCKRFYHRGDWQSKIRKEITGDVLTDMNQKLNVLRQISATSA